MEKIEILLSDELYSKIEHKANEEGISVPNKARELLTLYKDNFVYTSCERCKGRITYKDQLSRLATWVFVLGISATIMESALPGRVILGAFIFSILGFATLSAFIPKQPEPHHFGAKVVMWIGITTIGFFFCRSQAFDANSFAFTTMLFAIGTYYLHLKLFAPDVLEG